jgi:2-polyprenyl-3-methyl-5-hydroxy-6-metoxy-1,4-benzoquinol methylase
MLKNDESFWLPGVTKNATSLSWSGSDGDFSKLWEHSQIRWDFIVRKLTQVGAPFPGGRIIEFGSGMGLLDDLLDDRSSCLVMVDHTDAYLRERPRPLRPRCRHVLLSPEGLDSLRAESASYDWLILIAVFYHVEDATAAALILELGKLLKPGGYVLVHGLNPATAEMVRQMSSLQRLFSRYPRYVINLDLLRDTLAPDYQELCRQGILLYRKNPTPF